MDIHFLTLIQSFDSKDVPKKYRKHIQSIQCQGKLNTVHLYILSYVQHIDNAYKLIPIPLMRMRGYKYSIMRFILYMYNIQYKKIKTYYTSCIYCYPLECKLSCCSQGRDYKGIPSHVGEIYTCYDNCCTKFQMESHLYKSIVPL